MNRETPDSNLDEKELGSQLFDCIAELYPICRSITGAGVRETLSIIKRLIPLQIHEVPSGTQVFDWTVPEEWNIKDAWIKNAQGQRVVDFRRSNLHVVNYSVPVSRRLPLSQLRPHLFTLPEQPDLIPYRTSYYDKNWGFCLSQAQLDTLPEGEYEVCIDSSLQPGALSYGELLIPGESQEEVLLACHICHPSLANDNLSGVAIAAHLAQHLQSLAGTCGLRFSYRFLFAPATIGPISWLARNQSVLPRIRHGLVLACLGDSGPYTYKRSRRGDAEIDKAAAHIVRQQAHHEIVDFSPYGYDERQFCSPGFNLPVGRLTRSPHGSFPEYHTSADNLDFVQSSALADSMHTCLQILQLLEDNRVYLNQKPFGEPQLGKYGLYNAIGGDAASPAAHMAIRWVLNLADGNHSLLDIAEQAQLQFREIASAAAALVKAGLLREAP
jgi:aminopeptidase-like protein